jgi:LacI family transcriptional regulator
MVIGTLRAIRKAELCVPTDVAIVAIDDPPWAELVDPPLTVFAQPVRKMAETAIALLLDRIEDGGREPVRMLLPLEFHVRGSCGLHPTTLEDAEP